LVIFGFFMPIACDQNGFQLANYMTENSAVMSGLLLYLLILSAVVGAVIGVLLLLKKDVKPIVDWIVVIVCIVSGLIVYFTQLKDGVELQYGAYVILVGWIIALIAQIIFSISGYGKFVPVKTLVAIGIGSALIFVLRFGLRMVGLYNFDMVVIVVLSLFAAIFGPLAGLLIGFISSTLSLLCHWVWWGGVIAFAIFGLAVGLFWKLYRVEEGKFGVKQALIFNGVQIAANILAWGIIHPTLGMLTHIWSASEAYLSGLVYAARCAAAVLILGTPLAFWYSKTRTKR